MIVIATYLIFVFENQLIETIVVSFQQFCEINVFVTVIYLHHRHVIFHIHVFYLDLSVGYFIWLVTKKNKQKQNQVGWEDVYMSLIPLPRFGIAMEIY